MGASKTEAFTDLQNQIALWAKALGHPARIAIIECLLRRGACQTTHLVDELPLAQATISQHLRELKDAGIVQGEVEGARICYCLNPQTLSQLQAVLQGWQHNLAQAQPCC